MLLALVGLSVSMEKGAREEDIETPTNLPLRGTFLNLSTSKHKCFIKLLLVTNHHLWLVNYVQLGRRLQVRQTWTKRLCHRRLCLSQLFQAKLPAYRYLVSFKAHQSWVNNAQLTWNALGTGFFLSFYWGSFWPTFPQLEPCSRHHFVINRFFSFLHHYLAAERMPCNSTLCKKC